MKTWMRVAGAKVSCGYCGVDVVAGEPVLVLGSKGGTWKKYRCRDCAGEPVPPALASPPSADAVGPSAADPGTPTTREDSA